MKTWTIGDIHGSAKALKQVIERSGADIKKDKFIVLGDVTDGWSEVAESIEILMTITIENLVYITGNHDLWVREFLNLETISPNIILPKYRSWIIQGGQATIDSYERNPELLDKHLEFLNNSSPYHIDNNRLFVHGGYLPHIPIEEQEEFDLAWDRWFWMATLEGGIDEEKNYQNYDEIYIGHTPTIKFGESSKYQKPLNYGNVWNMDTGATYTGKLSIMNIDTKEVFQSDIVKYLYPNEKGRN